MFKCPMVKFLSIVFICITFNACSNSSTEIEEFHQYNDYSYDVSEVGFSGTETMDACNVNSGNCYSLDVESTGDEIEMLYFENGGSVDVYSSDCEDGYCYVEDENGVEWELEY